MGGLGRRRRGMLIPKIIRVSGAVVPGWDLPAASVGARLSVGVGVGVTSP